MTIGDLTRPIVGIENRTAAEVFDIMCDRIRRAHAREAGAQEPGAEEDCLPTTPLQKRVVGTISPSPSQWNAGAGAEAFAAGARAMKRAVVENTDHYGRIDVESILALPLPTPAGEG